MKDIIYKILWSTIEDFVGLWEIHWELNSLFPKKNKKENKELLKKILQYFLATGLVTFYFSRWGSDELKEIRFDEAIEIINKEKFWNAPSLNEVCIKIGCTEKGEAYYNKELINLLI